MNNKGDDQTAQIWPLLFTYSINRFSYGVTQLICGSDIQFGTSNLNWDKKTKAEKKSGMVISS